MVVDRWFPTPTLPRASKDLPHSSLPPPPRRRYRPGYNRSPPLTLRTYQILPHTHSYFHRLYSSLDLLPQGPLGYPRGGKAPLAP